MKKNMRANRFLPEVRAGVRMVYEHRNNYDSQSAAIAGITAKIGCIPETLRRWGHQAETNSGLRDGVTSDERSRIKALERENKELRQANEILRKASAYFAQAEFARPLKRYVSIKYTGRLAEAGIEPSVGSVGVSYGGIHRTSSGPNKETGPTLALIGQVRTMEKSL